MRDPVGSAEVEQVPPHEHFGERLFLAARTGLGVPLVDLERDFKEVVGGAWSRFEVVLEELVAAGLLSVDEGKLRATHKGLDLADTIAERLWLAGASV